MTEKPAAELTPKQLELIRDRIAEYRADPKPGKSVKQAIAEIKAARK